MLTALIFSKSSKNTDEMRLNKMSTIIPLQAQTNNQQNGPSLYEPNNNVKNSYLLLRKNGAVFAKLQLPGLFDYNLGHDKLLFSFGLFLEIITAFGLYVFASTKFSSQIVVILCGLLFVILMDYVACVSHQYLVVRKRTIKQNKKLLMISQLNQNNAGYTTYLNALDANFPDPIFWDRFLKSVIWILALARMIIFVALALGSKLFYFYTKQSGVMPYWGLGIVILCYIFIALIHTNITGYAIASVWHNILKKRDFKAFCKPLLNTSHEPTIIEKRIDLQNFVDSLKNDPDKRCQSLIGYDLTQRNDDIATGFIFDSIILNTNIIHTTYHPHQIIGDNNNKTCCSIKSVGFLDDDSLFRMIRVQETDLAKYAIALYGVSIQLELLDNSYTQIAQNND